MSNKSGASGQIISLPKGGGALKAIGEKFSPDPIICTGNITVPIALPPGRHSLQPQLNLVYTAPAAGPEAVREVLEDAAALPGPGGGPGRWTLCIAI